jgi:hypothetical protein
VKWNGYRFQILIIQDSQECKHQLCKAAILTQCHSPSAPAWRTRLWNAAAISPGRDDRYRKIAIAIENKIEIAIDAPCFDFTGSTRCLPAGF